MLSFANLWRAALLLLVIAGLTFTIEAVTDDQGFLLLAAVVIVVPLVAALWPVALGLKRPPPAERRGDAPPRTNGSPRTNRSPRT